MSTETIVAFPRVQSSREMLRRKLQEYLAGAADRSLSRVVPEPSIAPLIGEAMVREVREGRFPRTPQPNAIIATPKALAWGLPQAFSEAWREAMGIPPLILKTVPTSKTSLRFNREYEPRVIAVLAVAYPPGWGHESWHRLVTLLYQNRLRHHVSLVLVITDERPKKKRGLFGTSVPLVEKGRLVPLVSLFPIDELRPLP